MRNIIQNLNDITDSTELLEARPKPFTIIFMYILILFLVSALLWSYFGEIDEVVKAKGVLRPNNQISTIKNVVNGKIEKVNIKEGAHVESGEILYTLDTQNLDFKINEASLFVDKKQVEYNNLVKLKQCMIEKKNLFNPSDEAEKEYYYKYEKYKLDLQEESQNKQLANEKVLALDQKLENEQTLLKSVNDGVNYFNESNKEYYYIYENYKVKKDELEKQVSFAKVNYDRYKELFDGGIIAKSDFEDSEKSYEQAKINLDKFESDTKANLSSQIQNDKNVLSQGSIEKDKLSRSVGIKDDGNYSYLETNNIVALDEAIKKSEVELKDAKVNLNELENVKSQSIIKSPMSGTVKMQKEMVTGDNILAGENVATIIPKNQDEFKVNIYVSNSDISNIKVGDTIKYHFKALPFKEYGEFKGKITNISSDATFDEESGFNYYIEGSLENKPVYDYDGTEKKVKVGMTADVHIVTSRKKIIYYILEKLDLRN